MKTSIQKTIINLALVIFLVFVSLAFQQVQEAPCDGKTLKERAKKELDPYTYDMAKLTHVSYRGKPTFKEIEAPLFIGEKYRLVFNTEALPKQVIINVYNKDKDSKKRKLLFTTKGTAADQKQFWVDLSLLRKAFIDYEIPEGDSTASGGCLVFMLGYKTGKM